MADPTVLIDGIERPGLTLVESVEITKSINDRSRMRCELMERAGIYRPVVGNPIVIAQDGTYRFAGLIEDIEEQAIAGNSSAIGYQLTATDHTRLLDWRLYAGSFENVSFYSIVSTIMNAKFAGDGITLEGVTNPGPTITTRIQDGLRPVTEWFRKLSTETGYLFHIDGNKVLHFGPLATSPPNPAPFSITFGSLNWRELRVKRSIGDYRNVQYVRTEYRVTSSLTANFTGDGSTRDFYQSQAPFANVPSVTVNGTPQTVGRFGIDLSGFDVYYDVEGWGIHRYGSQSAFSNGAAIAVSFAAQFSNTTVAEDSAEIAARAAIQANSGRIEAIHEDRYLDTKEALDSRAEGLLRQYGALSIVLDFETDSRIEPDSDGLEPGQLLDVDLTDGRSDVNDSFLVESVSSRWMATSPDDIWVHRIHATNQEPHGQKSVTPIEKLAEQVRIGPDAASVTTPLGGRVYSAQYTLSSGSPQTVSSPVSTPVENDLFAVELIQDGSGNGTLSFGATFHNVTNFTPDVRANRITSLLFQAHSDGHWYLVSRTAGMED
jgi:hypothetical protein